MKWKDASRWGGKVREEEMEVGEEGLKLQCVGEGKNADIRQNREFYVLVYVNITLISSRTAQ